MGERSRSTASPLYVFVLVGLDGLPVGIAGFFWTRPAARAFIASHGLIEVRVRRAKLTVFNK